MWDLFVDFFFPKKCVVCGVLETNLCKDCKDNLSFVEHQVCPMCGKGSLMGWTHEKCKKKWGMDGLTVIYDYEDEGVRKIIDGIKYDFNQELVGDLLKDFVFEIGEKIEVIVPVPLYFYRENWRGFNQAALIGQVVGARCEVASAEMLGRVRNTVQQVKMKSRNERQKNIEGAFAVRTQELPPEADRQNSKTQDAEQLAGKKILLVDDVFTSGADMRECTKVLKRSGAKIVWGLALAH